MKPAHYLDAAAFTALFRHRHKNHHAICLGLKKIAHGAAAQFWFRKHEDRLESQLKALVHAIERIDRFKFRQGDDAFAYFSSMTYHRILRYLTREMKSNKRAKLFTDVPDYKIRFGDNLHRSLSRALRTAKPYHHAS